MEPAGSPPYIIVLVASLGGLQALGKILGGLPRDLAAPVVVLQHIMQDRQSYLVPLLNRATDMDVLTAEQGLKLHAGAVYVAPPGSHLEVDCNDRCRLTHGARVAHARPSADVLLRSLAGSCGARVLAVVLTGKGRDGADGAVEVRRCGGYVIAQNPDCCVAASMPAAAIGAFGTDAILSLEEIAPRLLSRMAGKKDRLERQ